MSGVKVWVKMTPLMSFKKSQDFVPLLCSRNVFIQLLSTDAKDRVSVDWSFAGLPCHKVTISARAFQGLRAVLAKPCGSHPFSWFLRPIFVVAKKRRMNIIILVRIFDRVQPNRLVISPFKLVFVMPWWWSDEVLWGVILYFSYFIYPTPEWLLVPVFLSVQASMSLSTVYSDACFFNTGKSNLRPL